MPLGQFRPKQNFNKAQRNQLRWNRMMELYGSHWDPEMVEVPGDGPEDAEVMFIGERPGKDEPFAEPPRPFVGAAGMELDRYLRMAGLSRSQVYVTNLVKTYRDADPEEWEVVRDDEALRLEIERIKPRIIVPLGAFATKHILGEWATMDVVSGVPTRTEDGILQNSGSAIVLPIVHPAAGLHSVDSMPAIVDGFHRLQLAIQGKLQVIKDDNPKRYTVAARGVLFGGAHPIGDLVAIDTEGSRREPWCLTYSSEPHRATMLKRDYRTFNSILQGSGATVLLHNSMHDLDVLWAMGITVPEGKFIDTMVMAYLLCVEPQGLKSLAYRHLGRLRPSYDELVSPHAHRKALDYICMAETVQWPKSEPYVLVTAEKGKGLVPKIKTPHDMNRKLKALITEATKKELGSEKGQLDIPKRWATWKKDTPWMLEPIEDRMGELPEATLEDVDPQVALDYACADADDTLRIYPKLQAEIDRMELNEVMGIDHSVIPMVNWMQRKGIYVGDKGIAHLTKLSSQMETEMEGIQASIKRETGAWINPDSGDQCAELLFDQLQLPWTKLTKSKSRPKCDDKVLEGLRGSHPVVSMVTDYRERSKIRGSFCKPIIRSALSNEDRRCRCRVRVTRVSSGRLSATDPNLLAIPVRSKLGLEVRNGFSAPEGRRVGTRDLDQIEMREMAHQSKDRTMVRIFNEGKVDIHRQTGSFVFGCRPDDVTSFQRYAAKRCGFGVITGITGLGLYDQIQMALALLPDEERRRQEQWDEKKCDRIISEWFKMYSGVGDFMEACRCEARRYGYVRDRWGRIRYLPAVYSPIKHVAQEAERQSHSFKISASAQGTMKIWMSNIWQDLRPYWGYTMDPLLQVHDELLKEVDEGQEPIVDESETRCLQDPRIQMIVPIKSKGVWGDTWGSLEK